MKYCVMSVALPVSLALCPQPVLPPKRAMGEAALLGRSLRQPAERLPRTQPLPALQAKMCGPPFLPLPLSRGTLMVGKIGADIAQQQARG